jgi:chemotaxis protein methyltransferase CheR
LGLHYTEKQEKELYSKISSASQSFDFSSADSFIEWLLRQKLSDAQIKKLASHLTIGETYFFREKKALEFLERKYLPDLISKRRAKSKTLKIWSAGCSSGEEPYTIAIMLTRIIPNIQNWDITILGTDINYKFLQKAKSGIYSKWSFRGIPESYKSDYFEEIDNSKYRIKSSIRDMVNFSYLNLANPPYYPSKSNSNFFDIIFCRNVLIYFSHEGIQMVTENFYNNLRKGGVLLLSPVETSNLIHQSFNRLPFNGITVYEKNPETQQKRSFIGGISRKKADISNRRAKLISPKTTAFVTTKQNKKKDASQHDKGLDIVALKTLYKSGSFKQVEGIIKKAIDQGENKNPEFYLLLAHIKANQGILDEAEKHCKKAIDLDKVNTKAYYLLANIFNEQGKTAEAIASINKTLFLDPNFSMAHFLLGNMTRVHNANEARKHYNNALKSLASLNNEDLVSGSDGLTARRLSEMIRSIANINIIV